MNFDAIKSNLAHRTIGAVGGRRPCAVLVPLVEQDGQLCLLFEVRSSKLEMQPGEVCFPGGGMEAGETPTECALRETQEELGIALEEIEVLGALDYTVHLSGFPVFPILARLPKDWSEKVIPSPAEVAEVFTIPLSYLRTTPPRMTQVERKFHALDPLPESERALIEEYPRRDLLPMLFWSYEGHLLWGMTARITDWLLDWLKENG
jgi:peroxisomal coenzyme A diphosphatase NUDT7